MENIASLKFTERIEREVLIVAGICDSDNHQLNNVRGKYQGQKLSDGYFREMEKEEPNNSDKVIADHDKIDMSIDSQMELHRQLGKQLTFKGLPIDSKQFVPLVLLVPHMCSHGGDKSIPFIQIVSTISKV